MPATTACAAIPYPLDTDPIDVANDMRRMAEGVDVALCTLSVIPLGMILPYYDTGAVLSSDFLRCNGAAFNPVTYPFLSVHLGGAAFLPDLRERFLRGTGGVFPTNAQTGGFADATLVGHDHDGPSHTHTNNHSHTGSSGNVSNDHTHGFGGTTGNENNNHAHGFATGGGGHLHTVRVSYGQAGSQSPLGAGYSWHGFEYAESTAGPGEHSHSGTTAGISVNHGHAYSGNTGGISANHNHAVTVSDHSGLTGQSGTGKTSAIGQAASNRNLPPFFNVTFVIKAVP